MDLENLGKIQKVEAPPFLFKRIQQKIESERKQQMPKAFALAINFSFAVVLLINVLVFVGNISETNSAESYAQSIHLISNNNLYK